MITKIILVAILILSIVLPFGTYFFSKRKSGGFKAALGCNIFFFFATIVIADILLFGGHVSAFEGSQVASTVGSNVEGFRYLAAALATGCSCIGAGIAVASAASSAIGALSEDASVMGKALIFVALAESIALYGLLISFSILG